MKLLFSALPAYGHIYPLIPLALAAQAAGHGVVFATAAELHPSLEAFGIEPALAGASFREAFVAAQDVVRPAALTPEQAIDFKGRVFGSALPRLFVRDLSPLLDRLQPDLVVHEAANPGAFLAARLAGIPGVSHGFGRVAFGPELDLDPLAVSAKRALLAFADELGVALPGDFRPGYGDPYLDVCPPSLQNSEYRPGEERILLRPVPINEPSELPRWVLERAPDRPLAYLTLGTVVGQGSVLREALCGLIALNLDVLVATGPTVDPAALGEVPRSVRVERWVPQAQLVPYMDLVVHHGGAGTALAALCSGVPQLLLLQGPVGNRAMLDGFLRSGAGDCVLKESFSAAAVQAAAERLLIEKSYAQAAQAIGAEIARMPAPREVVALLAKLASPSAARATPADRRRG